MNTLTSPSQDDLVALNADEFIPVPRQTNNEPLFVQEPQRPGCFRRWSGPTGRHAGDFGYTIYRLKPLASDLVAALKDAIDFVNPSTNPHPETNREKMEKWNRVVRKFDGLPIDAPTTALLAEISALRIILSKVATAAGSACAPSASLEFLQHIPNEVSLVIQRAKMPTSHVS